MPAGDIFSKDNVAIRLPMDAVVDAATRFVASNRATRSLLLRRKRVSSRGCTFRHYRRDNPRITKEQLMSTWRAHATHLARDTSRSLHQANRNVFLNALVDALNTFANFNANSK